MKKHPKTIEEIYEISSHESILDNLRLLIKNTVPEAVESIRRGGITYRLNEKDFLRIYNYATHVDLGFENGTRIASSLLKKRGKGTSWRHLELKSLVDVKNSEVKRLLKRSAELFLIRDV